MAGHKFKKGEPRAPGAGRKKGTPNKVTTVKQAFMDAMDDLGGAEFLKEVAATPSGRIAFMNSVARLLPKPVEVSGPDGKPISVVGKIEVSVKLVKPSSGK
jgi:hypothetical protein